MRKSFASIGAIAASLVCTIDVAHAQNEAPESGLGDIVVTAQRRSESVQNVPASITAVDAKALENLGIRTVNELTATTPSLRINLPFGEGALPNFSIRGVTLGSFNVQQGRPVALYVDESLRALGALEFVPIYDVERVEVLKGPQGSLYGLNAVGGAINVITQRPTFEQNGYLTLGYGNYNRREARGAAQAVLIDDVLSVRAAFTVIKADAYVKNRLEGARDRGNTDVASGRLGIRFKPSSSLDTVLTVSRTTSDYNGYSYYSPDIGSGQNTFLSTNREGLGYYEERATGDNRGRSATTGINFRANYDFASALLTSITSYDTGSYFSRNDDAGYEYSTGDTTYSLSGIKQFYQELRLQSQGNGQFKWLIGASFLRDVGNVKAKNLIYNDEFYEENGAGGIPANFAQNYGNSGRHRHRNISTYGRVEFKPTDMVSIFGGLRYQSDKVSYLNYNTFQDFGTLNAYGTVVPELANVYREVDAQKVSFEGGVDVRPANKMLVYATFKQGFRGGAANSQIYFNIGDASTVKPETLNAYEAGIKWDISNALRFNGAIFRYDYKNQQYLGALPGNAFAFGLVNAGSSRINGAELELKFSPIHELIFSAAATILDPKYRKFILSGVDLSGFQIVRAPKTALTFGVDANIAEMGDGTFTLHADTQYQSRVFYNAQNDRAVSDPSRWLVNGRIAWAQGDSGLSVGVWAQNLLQQRYFTSGYDGRPYFGQLELTRGAPRSFGADITFRY